MEKRKGFLDDDDFDEESDEHVKRSKKLFNSKLIIIIAIIVVAVIAFIVFRTTFSASQNTKTDEDVVQTQQIAVDDITHLSFPVLRLSSDGSGLSVEEFTSILQQLYENDYMLIDISELFSTDEDGKFVSKDTVQFPERKKPLIISQMDASYAFDSAQITADKLVVEDEKLKSQITAADGSVLTGCYDVISIMESFIENNPDFSYNNARGIIGLTGYRGILGYRTSSYLGSEENNPYGVYDTAAETEAVKPVIDKLRENGWRFASNGFAADISYGSELSIVQSDADSWNDQVGSIVSGTEMIILPEETDIGSWSIYTSDNTKYTYLCDKGFKYYFADNQETPFMLQITSDYFRQLIFEVNSYSDFVQVMPFASQQVTADETQSGDTEREAQTEVTEDQAADSEEQDAASDESGSGNQNDSNADEADTEQTDEAQ